MRKFIGNEKKIKLIEKIARSLKPDGAYIIAGPGGVGKKNAANYFTKLLIGDQTPEASIYWIAPEIIKKKGKIREKEITVGQIREALNFMNLKSFKSSCMVCVIEKAEKMHLAAQNALLKNLEEPKRGNVFLLITESEKKLLPTVRSRSTVIKLGLADPGKIFRQLVEEGIAKDKAREIAYYSWGRLEYSQKLMESQGSFQALETVEKGFLALMKAPLFEKMNYLEKEGNSKKILQKVDLWISFLLANLEERLTGDFPIIEKSSKISLSSKELMLLLENLLDLRKKLKYTHASARLALEAALL